MKVSEYLRQFRNSGVLPDIEGDMMPFWAGWLIGNASSNNKGEPKKSAKDFIDTAIDAAKFIEDQK